MGSINVSRMDAILQMKICFVSLWLEAGGAERVVVNLANRYVKIGHNVSIVTLGSEKQGSFYPVDSKVRMQYLNLLYDSCIPKTIMKFVKSIAALYKIRKIIKNNKPDVVVPFMYSAGILTLLACIGLKEKIIVSERVDPFSHSAGIICHLLRNLTYRWAKYIVVQTESIGKFFYNLGKKVIVIPNIARAAPSDFKKDARQNNIITVGRLDQQKAHDVLIKAFAKISNEYPECTLTIYGEGALRKKLEQLAEDCHIKNKVHFPGVAKNVWEVLSKGHIFVFPSRYEGFPNALCEAMAIGLPVVATECTGSRDIITHEEDGLLVSIDNVDALADAIKRLLGNSDLQNKLSDNAKKICDKYSEDKIYGLWDNIINNIG